MRLRDVMLVSLLAGAVFACGDEPGPPGTGGGGAGGMAPTWTLVHDKLPGALLSVWGTSESDVWTVGGDARDGTGPLVLHYDGTAWSRVETGLTAGDLWWVYGFEGGPIFMGGAGGVILRYAGGQFETMTTPGTGTVFGLWGATPTDMWAVGGVLDKEGFAWRLVSDMWTPEPSLPAADVMDAAVWKVFGRAAGDAVLVGSSGLAYTWDGDALAPAQTGVGSSLFTVHATASRYVAVGGLATGIIVENDGGGWQDVFPGGALNGLTGVVLAGEEGGYAVGQFGSIYERSAAGWQESDVDLGIQLDLHGVWADPQGGAWAVGGRTASFPLVEGLLLYRGNKVPPSEL
ncbi:MAG: hypothetical protein KC731_35360 [Myxococcales bacterium]|nr:hypothetical protein [Myxococcales bacterium]